MHPICLVLLLVLLGGRLVAQTDYFQQRVDYRIEVRLDPARGQLHGHLRMTYYNRSPNVLTDLWIHLWPNAYKNKQTAWAKQKLRNGDASFYHSRRNERGFIDSLAFRVDGEFRRTWPHPEHIDIVRLPLPKPLMPGDSTIITTPFRVQVPKSFSRLGRIGDQYQITQWYPKPAVYDRNGWHPMPYLDQGEFYSEFGTYDVSITVPEHYVVGATGRLINNPAEEEFMRQREARSRQLLKDEPKTDTPFPAPAQPRTKTLRFVQEDVHDFAWFCDPQYLVLTDRMQLPSGRSVELVALFNYNNSESGWKQATQYLREGVLYYSQIVGEYPYSRCTAVDGALSAGAGMEYPMITVVSAKGGRETLRRTIIHEVGHNWFYGILASNEREHPWMDEGFNTYVEYRAVKLARSAEQRRLDSSKKKDQEEEDDDDDERSLDLGSLLTLKAGNLGFAYTQGANLNQPLTLPADEYSNINYGLDVYLRMTQLLKYLELYLGREVMDRCLQTYFKDWYNKHPSPADLKASFEKAAQQDLSWFFDELLPSAEPVRLRLKSMRELEPGKLEVVVENRSNYRLPVRLVVLGEAGDTLSQGWLPPFLGENTTTVLIRQPARRVVVGHDSQLVEPNLQNNISDWPKPALKIGLRLEPRPDRRDLNFLPVVGYNSRDENMLGLFLAFQPFPKRGFEFHVMPMYSLNREHWTGSAGLTLRANQFPYGHALRKLEFNARGMLFADLIRLRHSVAFHFAAPRPSRPRTSVLTLRTHQMGWRDAEGNLRLVGNGRPAYSAADWRYEVDRKVIRWGLRAEIGGREGGVLRTHVAPELMWWPRKRLKMHARVFLGAFLDRGRVPLPLRYRLSGSFDPLGEQYFVDRRNFFPLGETDALPATIRSDFWSRQLVEDHGGFRSLILNPGTDRWLATFNYSLTLPYLFEIFFDGGVQPNEAGRGLRYYDAGVVVRLIDRVLHINFPLAGSIYRDDVPQTWNEFTRQINFTLQLNELLKKIPY